MAHCRLCVCVNNASWWITNILEFIITDLVLITSISDNLLFCSSVRLIRSYDILGEVKEVFLTYYYRDTLLVWLMRWGVTLPTNEYLLRPSFISIKLSMRFLFQWDLSPALADQRSPSFILFRSTDVVILVSSPWLAQHTTNCSITLTDLQFVISIYYLRQIRDITSRFGGRVQGSLIERKTNVTVL